MGCEGGRKKEHQMERTVVSTEECSCLRWSCYPVFLRVLPNLPLPVLFSPPAKFCLHPFPSDKVLSLKIHLRCPLLCEDFIKSRYSEPLSPRAPRYHVHGLLLEHWAHRCSTESKSYQFLLIPLLKIPHWKWVTGYTGIISL